MMRDETPRVAVIGALPAEVSGLREAMLVEAEGRDAGYRWWSGEMAGRSVVLALGGMGKVASAASAQHLISRWNLSTVVVCGMAGGLDERLRPGDIVIADALMQHDVDASPIFPRFQLPGLGIDTLRPPAGLVTAADEAAARFLVENPLDSAVLARNGIAGPRALRGLIVTGDQFVEDREREVIRRALPDAICVEMEGAAIAQVCDLNGVPCCVVRIMSDNADGNARADFLQFMEEVTPAYVSGIVTRLLPRLP